MRRLLSIVLTVVAASTTAGVLLRSPCAAAAERSEEKGAYTATPSDCNTTVALGGRAFYTLTIQQAANYGDNCTITVQNIENDYTTWRAKKMAVHGLTDRLLWPGQTIAYSNRGAAWSIVAEPGRWQPTSPLTFYVNADLGNDDNDCLAGGSAACLTPAKAALLRYEAIDPRYTKSRVSIRLEDATAHYRANVLIVGAAVGEYQIFFVGNPIDPSRVVMDVGCGEFGFAARDYGVWNVSGVTLNGTCDSAVLLHASQFGVGDCGPAIVFQGTRTADFAADFAAISCAGALTVNGGTAAYHVNAGNQARVDLAGATLEIKGENSCTSFALSSDNAKVFTYRAYSGGTYTPGCVQFQASQGGHIGWTTPPPGSVEGRQYADSPLCPDGFVLGNISGAKQFPGCAPIASLVPFLISTLAVSKLSDYGAGSWKPTLFGSTAAGAPIYAIQVGSYERIGRQITARFIVQTSSLGGIAGNMHVGGLPVQAGGPSHDPGICTFSAFGGVTLDPAYTVLGGIIGSGSDWIYLQQSGSGLGTQLLSAESFADVTTIFGVCHYHN